MSCAAAAAVAAAAAAAAQVTLDIGKDYSHASMPVTQTLWKNRPSTRSKRFRSRLLFAITTANFWTRKASPKKPL